MKTRRLFFALWPHPAEQAALAEATRSVVDCSGGQAVPPENLHITLVFVGPVAESDLPRVEATASQVAQEASSAEPVPVALEVFEHWKKPRILCLTTQQPASPPAARLADLLHQHLTAAGFALDPRQFRPHVTLARKVSRGGTTPFQPPLQWTFRDFALIESQTGPSGSVYHCRSRFTVVPPTQC